MTYNIKTGDIIEALSNAQSEFPKLTQNKSGYNYEYLTLDNMLDTIRPIMGKHGLAIIQGHTIEVVEDQPFVCVQTSLLCKDEKMYCDLKYPLGDAPKGMSEIQYLGSIISYLRRYGLLGMLGVAGSEKEIEDIQTEQIKLK